MFYHSLILLFRSFYLFTHKAEHLPQKALFSSDCRFCSACLLSLAGASSFRSSACIPWPPSKPWKGQRRWTALVGQVATEKNDCCVWLCDCLRMTCFHCFPFSFTIAVLYNILYKLSVSSMDGWFFLWFFSVAKQTCPCSFAPAVGISDISVLQGRCEYGRWGRCCRSGKLDVPTARQNSTRAKHLWIGSARRAQCRCEFCRVHPIYDLGTIYGRDPGQEFSDPNACETHRLRSCTLSIWKCLYTSAPWNPIPGLSTWSPPGRDPHLSYSGVFNHLSDSSIWNSRLSGKPSRGISGAPDQTRLGT